MNVNLKEFILYNKALLVSILASGMDMGTMYMLDRKSNLAENLIIGKFIKPKIDIAEVILFKLSLF